MLDPAEKGMDVGPEYLPAQFVLTGRICPAGRTKQEHMIEGRAVPWAACRCILAIQDAAEKKSWGKKQKFHRLYGSIGSNTIY